MSLRVWIWLFLLAGLPAQASNGPTEAARFVGALKLCTQFVSNAVTEAHFPAWTVESEASQPCRSCSGVTKILHDPEGKHQSVAVHYSKQSGITQIACESYGDGPQQERATQVAINRWSAPLLDKFQLERVYYSSGRLDGVTLKTCDRKDRPAAIRIRPDENSRMYFDVFAVIGDPDVQVLEPCIGG